MLPAPADESAKAAVPTASVDVAVDYEETARVANEAFPAGAFDAKHLRFLYEKSFSEGSTVVSLRWNGRKVGQFVIVRQTAMSGGVAEPSAQLVDLFILKEFRSREALTRLYGEVENQCRIQNIRFAIGMPNSAAIAANEHFLGLKPYLWLDIRAGISLPPWRTAPNLLINEEFAIGKADAYRKSFKPYQTAADEQGIAWTAEKLCERLSNPKFSYGVHAVDNLLLLSSPRVAKGKSYTLLCGFFARPGADVRSRDVRAVTRAACAMWRQPLFVYPGVNAAVKHLPGWRIPDRFRPSTMLVQLRDFRPEKPPLIFDRYQPIDFDFA